MPILASFSASPEISLVFAGCLLGKAGRSRFYAEWEPLAERLRKQLAVCVYDIASTLGTQNAPAASAASEFANNEDDGDDGSDGSERENAP